MIGWEVICDQLIYVIKIISLAGKELMEYFDVVIYLKLWIVMSLEEVIIMVDYDDYCEVEGLMYFYWVVFSGLMLVLFVFELKLLSVNIGILDKNFSQE